MNVLLSAGGLTIWASVIVFLLVILVLVVIILVAKAKLMPSIGFCGTPFSSIGAVTPANS